MAKCSAGSDQTEQNNDVIFGPRVVICKMRSAHEKRPMPHLWQSRMRVNGVETIHCSWCWKQAA